MSYSIYDELTKRDELTKKAEDKKKKTIERKLIDLLDDIISRSEEHLSQVEKFLPEYDDHSVKHAEVVLGNIDKIIGEEGIKKLSVYDLFIVAASAYLHDWGMALTGYEKKVLEIAEQEPLPVAEKGVEACKNLIKDNFSRVFGSQLQDALDTEILPNKETGLFDYLSGLYQKYQNYRSGYTEKYTNAKDDEERKNINKDIRQDYIRDTHHIRSAEYVNNWGNSIQKGDNNILSVMHAVARVVQSHGESIEEVKKLAIKTYYNAIDDKSDTNIANLQYASTMLRLGDIVHYTYDRAPVSLRKEMNFESQDSKEHWITKVDVTNQICKEKDYTKIVFNANCKLPRSYCYLKKYIGYINSEIDLFNALQSNWAERYQIPLANKVEDHVYPLNDAFVTKPDLTFTLNQNKIIELLMGVQLYSDPYTCLRELYQNSLDACRCAISRRKNHGEEKPTCTIEFGVKQDEGGKYIYCLDDGKGMSRNIIENYFLNIGSSYYKSKEFYTLWSKYNAGFTPTSQFGIGILSCFMVGHRLEVVTKEYEGNLIPFGVDGPQETFYYWNKNKVSSEDKETFERRSSGTLVKVYLKEQYAKEIDDGELEKFELLKCVDFSSYHNNRMEEKRQSGDYEDEDEKKYIDLFSRWKRHFYYKIFDFVHVPFPDINVKVYFAHKLYPIEARPHLANFVSDDYEKDKIYYNRYSYGWLKKNSHMVEYPFQICRANYIYHSMLCLPIDESESDYNQFTHAAICVDGIRIGKIRDIEDGVYRNTLNWLAEHGIFNFVGEHKPEIKVDRCSFVNEIHIDEAEQLFIDYVKEVIRIVNDHISKYNFGVGSSIYQLIWEKIIGYLHDSLKLLMTNEFDKTGYPEIKLNPLSDYFGVDTNVPAIMSSQSVSLSYQQGEHGRYPKADAFLLKKMSAISSVQPLPDGKLHLTFSDLPILPLLVGSIDEYAIAVPEDNRIFMDYDIVDYYYPLVARRLFNNTISNNRYFINEHDVMIMKTSIRFDRFVEDCWNEISGRRRGMFTTLDSIMVNNKHITIFRTAYPYYTDDIYGIGYLSICLHYNRNTHFEKKEFSFIMPLEREPINRDMLIVVEGKITRVEMDNIYLFVLEKYNRRW